MSVFEQSKTYESFDIPTRLYCLDLLAGWNWIEQAIYPPDMIFLGIILFHLKTSSNHQLQTTMKCQKDATNTLEQ